MLTNIVKKIKAVPSYFYRNYTAPKIYNVRDRRILSKNLELKNKFINKRCFILGAGPSIAHTDLARLNLECVFVVNDFEKNKQFRSLTPEFHVISESNYFTEGGPERRLDLFRDKDKHISMDTTMLLGLAARPFVNKYNLFKRHKVYYIGTQGIFTDNFPFNIGLDHYIPNPKNSILTCMIAAVWMGFKEIYLLGCEHSFLSQPLGKSKSLGFSHSYKDETFNLDTADNEILKKYVDSKELNCTYEANVANVLQLFKNYRLFYSKALKIHPDLQIFNATPNSFLDVFPIINFEDIKGL